MMNWNLPVEWLIGLRYLRANQRNVLVSIIALISILGIALGITVLIVIISVMNGLQNELRNRILGATEHVKITTADERLSNWGSVMESVEKEEHVQGFAPYIQGEVMITHGEFVRGVLVQGVMPDIEYNVSDFSQHMVAGELPVLKPGSFQIVLGEDLARGLNVDIGSEVTIVSPLAMITPAGMIPRVKRFKVAGIFKVDMFEFDSRIALVHLKDAARFFRYGENVSGVRLRLDDLFNAQTVVDSLSKKRPDLKVISWSEENVAFFQALRVEKVVMKVILTLVVLVAVFNIVSMLVMMVADKQGDIAILRTIGATPRSMMAVFMVQGSLIGIIGTIIGVNLGSFLAVFLESILSFVYEWTGWRIFPEDIYYIHEVPSELHLDDVLSIAVIALSLSVLSTLYPAWQAAKTKPAEVLRYDW